MLEGLAVIVMCCLGLFCGILSVGFAMYIIGRIVDKGE